ncbi:ArsR family transcriptional regulator [Natrialbaceae archaeon GCM10025810]|uniref:DUF7344 domain-containing protein n=1 Tax=Halovalidus salilacus TaxID=3075124 RepID=UPI0036074DAE
MANKWDTTDAEFSTSTVDERDRIDALFDALSSKRRRQLLSLLRDETRTSVADAARRIAAWESDRSIDDVPRERASALEIELVHVHLPKLRDAGIVEYDGRSRHAVMYDPPDLVERYLDRWASRDRPD